MKVEKFNYNDIDDLFANTYVLSDSDFNAVIIDPSKDYDGIITYLENNHLCPKAILLTHAHIDHMRGVKRLLSKYHLPVYIHSLEVDSLTNPLYNCSLMLGEAKKIDITDGLVEVKDKQVLKILNSDIRVIHTPYHTSGSVCYYLPEEKILFSGDTLFKESVGRSDLPTSAPRYMNESFNKIKALPKEVKVYPGHELNTTIEHELLFNRFLNY